MTPAILVVTGASGAGKTAAVQALDSRGLAAVRFYYFDSIGVPTVEIMERDFGGSEKWQAAATHKWVRRLAANPDATPIAVLEGQTRPSYVLEAFVQVGITLSRIVLLDCASEVRSRRIAQHRGQPELATARMDSWAAYLRGQADALGLPVIDTTRLSLLAAADALQRELDTLRQQVQAAA